jgi:ATP-dependent Clp protease ATP-binding subunit ClpA
MTDAFGKRVNGKNLFIVCTSNAGAEFIRKSIEKGVKGVDLQKNLINHILENGIFSPELINRFDGVIVYEPLGPEELRGVAKLILEKYCLQLKKKGIILELIPETIDKLSKDGYDPAFGARPMKRIVDLILGDLVGKAILNKEISDGDKIRIYPGSKKDEYSLQKVSDK